MSDDDRRITDLYRRTPRDAPSSLTDRRILHAAANAVRRERRWYSAPLWAAAASLLLVAGISWQLFSVGPTELTPSAPEKGREDAAMDAEQRAISAPPIPSRIQNEPVGQPAARKSAPAPAPPPAASRTAPSVQQQTAPFADAGDSTSSDRFDASAGFGSAVSERAEAASLSAECRRQLPSPDAAEAVWREALAVADRTHDTKRRECLVEGFRLRFGKPIEPAVETERR